MTKGVADKRKQKARASVMSAKKAAELRGEVLTPADVGIEFDGAVDIPKNLTKESSPPSTNPVDAAEIKGWNRTLPGGTRLEIRQVTGVGRDVYIDSYSYSEVEKEPTPEAFIKRYIVPETGGGRFSLHLLYPNGKRENRGEVEVFDNRKPVENEKKREDVKGILEVLGAERERMASEAKKREEQARQREETAVQQSIRAMQESQDRSMQMITAQLNNQQSQQQNNGGGDSTMMMMMMMMMQNMQSDSKRTIETITSKLEERSSVPSSGSESARMDSLIRQVTDKLDRLEDDSFSAPSRRSRRFDMDDLGGLDLFSTPTPPTPSAPEKPISEIISETAAAIGAQLKPKEEEPMIEKIIKYLPLIQPLINKFVDGNKEEKAELSRKLERMEEKLENERARLIEGGNSSDLEHMVNGLSFIRENERLLFPKKNEDLPMPGEKKDSFLDTISTLIPQAIGMLQNFQVPNQGGSTHLPNPQTQQTLAIPDLIRAMGNMPEEEVVQQLHGLMQLVPSVPGLGQKVIAALTGDPEKDTLVVAGLVQRLLTGMVDKSELSVTAAENILKVVQKHGATLVSSLRG